MTRRAIEVLNECAALMEKKDKDYNNFPQAEYYPRGLSDIWYMCFTKVKRLQSLIDNPRDANFEGVEDTARDLINYASFLIEFAEGKMNGQEPTKVEVDIKWSDEAIRQAYKELQEREAAEMPGDVRANLREGCGIAHPEDDDEWD